METKRKKGLFNKVTEFKKNHPTIYEFILFNLLSNVATITNFIFLWVGSFLLFKSYANTDFQWFIFDYSVKNGGMAGFLSFLLAYIIAQIVNFYVQKNLVFSADVELRKSLPWYIGTVVFAGIISIWLPPHIIDIIYPLTKGFSATIANIVNIILQVLINYPMMKYKIMKKS